MIYNKIMQNRQMKFRDKTIEAAIFDMDGTMFDTERLRFQMLKEASLKLFGQEMSDEVLYESLGVNATTGENIAKKEYGEKFPYQEIRTLADMFEREYIRKNGVPVKPGLYNLLERLKKNHVLLALATSSRREIAMEYLIHAKVLRYFDIVVCGDEVEHGKPDPEIFQKAASELCCETDKCLIIEDSSNGLRAAVAAGGIPIYIKDMKDAESDIIGKVFQGYNRMIDFRDDLIPYTTKMDVPDLFEIFPQNTDFEIAGIHGFGAIGGGYLAQIFSHWDGYTRPQKIIGATRNPMLIQLINSLGKYRIKYESLAYFQTIENAEIIDMNDEDLVIKMYETVNVMGLALPEKAIPMQAGLIAKALRNRFQKGKDKLTILVVMNKINASKFVKKQVQKQLETMTSKEEASNILNSVYFVETVVNRMVSMTAEENISGKIKNDLNLIYHNVTMNYEDLNSMLNVFHKSPDLLRQGSGGTTAKTTENVVSISKTMNIATQFVKEVEDINITLFNAEPDMTLYANDVSPYLERFRQIKVIHDIRSMQEIKNKLSNGTHAIIAWYSWLLGYRTIGQGMGDAEVEKIAKHIMKKEIRPALVAENPDYKNYIDSFISHFIKRCRVSFKDKCTRVGRDPMRKLQNGERVMGAIELAQNHHIETPCLEFGVACAVLYALKNTKGKDAEAEMIRTIYAQNHKIEDVLTYKGSYNKAGYKGLDKEKDKELLERIHVIFQKLLQEDQKGMGERRKAGTYQYILPWKEKCC